MKFYWSLLIKIVVVEVSLEECRRETFKSICWMKLNDMHFCTNFTNNALVCPDLKQLESNAADVENINSVVVHNDNISDTIYASSFENFADKIQIINITSSSIRYIEEDAFVRLLHVQYLFLSNNNIEELSDEMINGLENVEILDLSRNKISKVGKNILKYSPKLKELNLNHNLIRDLTFWGDSCEHLSYLDVSNNEIKTLKSPRCANLKYLNVAGNKLKSLTALSFGNESLTYLDVSSNWIYNIDDQFFKYFNKLEVLNLSRNIPFLQRDIPSHFFQHAPMLKELNLSAILINKLNFGLFAPLENLEVLDLSDNYIKMLPKHLFYKLNKLNQLYLNDNRLTYIDMNELPSPSRIYLENNLWNCETLAHIYATKPYDIEVVSDPTYHTANVHGISCKTDVENILEEEAPNNTDLISLQRLYLWSLVHGQADMKKAFAELKIYLNHTHSKQKHYSGDHLEGIVGSLLVRDAVLFSIFVAGVTITGILVLIHYGKDRRSRNERERGDLLRAISISS